MKKWMLLVDLSFDWSSGEYGISIVKNILLKTFEAETEEEAIIECKKEFTKQFEESEYGQGFFHTYGQADYYKAIEV